jgi:hypothetical protein
MLVIFLRCKKVEKVTKKSIKWEVRGEMHEDNKGMVISTSWRDLFRMTVQRGFVQNNVYNRLYE